MRTVLSALLVAGLAGPAAGAELLVPEQHETIQAAVTAALDGDTIVIAHGHYPESVVMTGKNQILLQAKGKVVIAPEAGIGLLLQDCTNITVERLRVQDGAPFGFQIVGGHDNRLLRCVASGAAQAGIRLDGGHTQFVERCTVTGGEGDGIALGTGAPEAVDDCLVTRCVVKDVGGDGLSVNGSNNRIEKSAALKPGGSGFVEDTATAGLLNVFEQCRAEQPADSGFVLRNNSSSVLAGRVSKSGGDALRLDSGATLVIEDCRVLKSFAGGLRVSTAGATIEGCRITGAAFDGITILGDEIELTNCRVTGAGGSGCTTSGSLGSFTGNRVRGSGVHGFVLEEGAEGNVLADNKASGSEEFDLFDDSLNETNDYEDGNSFKTIGVTVPAM
jgi:hypothetical protein